MVAVAAVACTASASAADKEEFISGAPCDCSDPPCKHEQIWEGYEIGNPPHWVSECDLLCIPVNRRDLPSWDCDHPPCMPELVCKGGR